MALIATKTRCLFCNRTLKDQSSIARGVGPECASRQSELNACMDAGLSYLRKTGDVKLAERNAAILQLRRIAALRGTSDPRWQRDMHDAREHFAKRVKELAQKGFLTIEIPANAPLLPDAGQEYSKKSLSFDASAPASFPTDYEICCEAVKEAEQIFHDVYRKNPYSVESIEALTVLRSAKEARAKAARTLINRRAYPVRRVDTNTGHATVAPAPQALERIALECGDPQLDLAAEDALLRAGETVFTFDAMYSKVSQGGV